MTQLIRYNDIHPQLKKYHDEKWYYDLKKYRWVKVE